MSEKIVLSAEKREVTGKKVKEVRSRGFVPATVYHKGEDSFNISIEYQPLVKAYSAAGQAQPVHLEVAGKQYLTMIKDIHMDPVKNTIMHVAFHAVDKNQPVEAEIPVHIEGDVPAEAKGNFIVRQNDHVLVKAIPSELPEVFNIDAGKLVDPGDTLTVADIVAPAHVEILSEPELQLAIVEEPRVVEEEPEEVVDAADVPAANGGENENEPDTKSAS